MTTTAVNLDTAGEIIEANLGTPMFIWGPPGVGKSAKVREIAARKGCNLIDLRLSQLDPTDLRGLPYFEDRGGDTRIARWAKPTFFPDVERHGPRGILFLDELSSAPPMVQASAYQLVLDRRVGDFVLPDEWFVVAAGNRVSDRSVVHKLSKALANRFLHLEIDVDTDVWRAWAYRVGIDPRIIGYIAWKGTNGLFDFRPDSEEPAFASPRTWEYSNKILNGPLNKAHIEIHKNEPLHMALAGAIGFGNATEFLNYVALTQHIPDMNVIVNTGGGNIKVPDDVGLRYAVVSGLVSRLVQALHREHERPTVQPFISNAMAFMSRFDAEFATLFVTDLAKTPLNVEIVKNDDFKKWRAENVEMFKAVV